MDTLAVTRRAMRPEHALMLYGIRAHFGTEPLEPAVALDVIDADVLLAEAGEHGLIPLMHRQLERLPGVPLAWREMFKAEAQRIVASNLVLGREMIVLSRRFADADLAVLAFKGPAQAVQAYGDLGFRPFSDLDVLVRWDEVERALDVLQAEGYDLPAPMPSLAELREHDYHVACEHPESGVLVEVHWHPVSNRFAVRLDTDGYWARAEPVAIMGQSVPAMGLEDTLLITCAHATKHAWERLEWAVSVAALVTRTETLDWHRVLQRAEQGGIRRVVLTGLALAHALSGVPLPAEISAAVDADARARSLAERVLRTVLQRSRAESPTSAEPLRTMRFHLLVRDTLRDGLRFLLTPKDTDRAMLSSDEVPLAVAVGARAYRLVKRHAAAQVAAFMQRRVR